jgi:hypothetical protein
VDYFPWSLSVFSGGDDGHTIGACASRHPFCEFFVSRLLGCFWRSDAYVIYVEHQIPKALVRLPRTLATACAMCERDRLWCGQPRLGRLADCHGVSPLAADSEYHDSA